MAVCWQSTGTDFNRYIQTLRRIHRTGLEYIRAVEAHADGYPHIHIVLQFHDVCTVENDRYFSSDLYKKWKQSWKRGFSDAKAPRVGEVYPILYLVKYISKNTPTHKTLWRKLLAQDAIKNNHSASASIVTGANKTTNTKVLQITNKELLTLLFSINFKIKQLSWSRSFKFPALRKPNALPSPLLIATAQET